MQPFMSGDEDESLGLLVEAETEKLRGEQTFYIL